MDIIYRLQVLQRQVAQQTGYKVDCYHMEGYGALFVPHGHPPLPQHVIFAFPDIAIHQ